MRTNIASPILAITIFKNILYNVKKMNESVIHDQSCRWAYKTESHMNLLELGEDILVKQACNLRAILLWANKANKYV